MGIKPEKGEGSREVRGKEPGGRCNLVGKYFHPFPTSNATNLKSERSLAQKRNNVFMIQPCGKSRGVRVGTVLAWISVPLPSGHVARRIYLTDFCCPRFYSCPHFTVYSQNPPHCHASLATCKGASVVSPMDSPYRPSPDTHRTYFLTLFKCLLKSLFTEVAPMSIFNAGNLAPPHSFMLS